MELAIHWVRGFPRIGSRAWRVIMGDEAVAPTLC
jgi:hypothetical protein